MAKLQDYLEQVNVFSALKEEPEWMLELRQAALAKVDELAFPKIERVRYERWPLFNIDEQALAGEKEFAGFIDPTLPASESKETGAGLAPALTRWITIRPSFSSMTPPSLSNYRKS